MDEVSKETKELSEWIILQTTFYSVRAIFLATLNIDQMKNLLDRLEKWLIDHEKSMKK